MGEGGTPTLTRNGRAVAVGAIALGVVGWAFGYVALTVVTVGAIVALVAGWFVVRQVPHLEVERAIEPARVQRGVPARGVVSIRNPGRRHSRPCTAVEHAAGEEFVIAVPALAPGRAVAASNALATNRRGAHDIGPLTVGRQDLFGLWRCERTVGTSMTLLVEPRVMPIPPRPAGRTRHVEGPVSDMAPRGTQTFHSLREYSAGDDVRRVHWRSSARVGKLMVREHIDTSLPSTVVVLDCTTDHYTDDGFEEAVDVAASVVASAQGNGFPVRVVTSTGEVVASRAGQRGQHLRDLLARVQTTETAPLRTATTTVLSARDHDVIVVVAGRLPIADLGQVTLMCRRYASPTLVTIEPADGAGTRWPDGAHLSGATAAEILGGWRAGRSVARPTAVPA